MEALPPGYTSVPRLSAAHFLNRHQLPLYGVMYIPEKGKYLHTISGLERPECELTVDPRENESEIAFTEHEQYDPPFNVFLGV